MKSIVVAGCCFLAALLLVYFGKAVPEPGGPSRVVSRPPSIVATSSNTGQRHLNAYERLLSLRRHEEGSTEIAARLLSVENDRPETGDEFFRQLCDSNPLHAFRLACSIPSPSRLDRIDLALLRAFHLTPDDAFSMIEEVAGFPLRLSYGAYPQILQSSEKYRERILNLPIETGAYREDLIRGLAAKLYAEDPQTTKKWLETLGPSAQRTAMKGFYDAWLETSSEDLPDLDETIQGSLRMDIAERVIERIAKESPELAIEWINDQLSGFAKDQAIGDVIVNLAKRGHGTHAFQLVEQMPAGTIRQRVGFGVVGALTASQPEGALQLLASLSEEDFPEKPAYLRKVAMQWYTASPSKALEYVRREGHELSTDFLSGLADEIIKENATSASSQEVPLPEPLNLIVKEKLHNAQSAE